MRRARGRRRRACRLPFHIKGVGARFQPATVSSNHPPYLTTIPTAEYRAGLRHVPTTTRPAQRSCAQPACPPSKSGAAAAAPGLNDRPPLVPLARRIRRGPLRADLRPFALEPGLEYPLRGRFDLDRPHFPRGRAEQRQEFRRPAPHIFMRLPRGLLFRLPTGPRLRAGLLRPGLVLPPNGHASRLAP